jgi:hypothetical protein
MARAIKAPQPWQGGYNDFIQYSTVQEAVEAETPPRTSAFDDLCFYHTHHYKHLRLNSDPKSATSFAQKLVASEYMLLIEYNKFLLYHIGWKLSRQNSFEIFDSVWVEQTWSDLNSFHQRIHTHHQNAVMVTANLELKKSTNKDWMSTTEDFAHIEEQFLSLRQKAESLLDSFTGLAGMVGNRQSLNEARSVGLLTVLGMAFVPLSLVASLFSMSDDYRPGAGDFWVYFAVSIPFVVLMFAMTFLLRYWRNFRQELEGMLGNKK